MLARIATPKWTRPFDQALLGFPPLVSVNPRRFLSRPSVSWGLRKKRRVNRPCYRNQRQSILRRRLFKHLAGRKLLLHGHWRVLNIEGGRAGVYDSLSSTRLDRASKECRGSLPPPSCRSFS
jgi:hypothetical protein